MTGLPTSEDFVAEALSLLSEAERKLGLLRQLLASRKTLSQAKVREARKILGMTRPYRDKAAFIASLSGHTSERPSRKGKAG